MSESTILWKFLSREFPDNHTVIFLYVCGNKLNQENVIVKILNLCLPIFSTPLTKQHLKPIIKDFLDMKKKQYLNGEIKIKPFYND